jgi:hypothetical protein
MPDPGMHSVGAVMPSPYYEIGVMPIRDDGVLCCRLLDETIMLQQHFFIVSL